MCGRGRHYGPQGYGGGNGCGWGGRGGGWGGRGGGAWCHRGGGWGPPRVYGGCHGRRFSGPAIYPQLTIPQQPTHERRRSEGSISNVYAPPKPTVVEKKPIERKPVARTNTTLSRPPITNTTPSQAHSTATKLRKSSEPSRKASTKATQPSLPERRLSLPTNTISEGPDFKEWGPPPPYVEPVQTESLTRHNSTRSRTSSFSTRSEPIVPPPLFRDNTTSRPITRGNSVHSFAPSVPELILPEDPDPFEDQSDYEELPEPRGEELTSPVSVDEGYGTLSEADLRNLPNPRENQYTRERHRPAPGFDSRNLNVGPWFPNINPPYPRSEASFAMNEQNAPRRPPKIPLDRPAEEGWLIPVIVEPDGDLAVDAVRQLEQERNETGAVGESGVKKLGRRVLGHLI